MPARTSKPHGSRGILLQAVPTATLKWIFYFYKVYTGRFIEMVPESTGHRTNKTKRAPCTPGRFFIEKKEFGVPLIDAQKPRFESERSSKLVLNIGIPQFWRC
jgi:hypothetical protein